MTEFDSPVREVEGSMEAWLDFLFFSELVVYYTGPYKASTINILWVCWSSRRTLLPPSAPHPVILWTCGEPVLYVELQGLSVFTLHLLYLLLHLRLSEPLKSCHVSGWFRRRWRWTPQMTRTIRRVRAWPRPRRRRAAEGRSSSNMEDATRVSVLPDAAHVLQHDKLLLWQKHLPKKKTHSQPYQWLPW